MVIRENATVKHIYFIVSGPLRLYFADAEAKEHIISFSMEDWWETDHRAFFTQTKATQSLADFLLKNIVRLTVYTTIHPEFFENFHVWQNWISKHGILQTSTVVEVKTLSETLNVEMEATVVK